MSDDSVVRLLWHAIGFVFAVITARVSGGVALTGMHQRITATTGNDASTLILIASRRIVVRIVIIRGMARRGGAVGNHAILFRSGVVACSVAWGGDRCHLIVTGKIDIAGKIGCSVGVAGPAVPLALEKITAPTVATGKLSCSHEQLYVA